jgi:hypothetical protein
VRPTHHIITWWSSAITLGEHKVRPYEKLSFDGEMVFASLGLGVKLNQVLLGRCPPGINFEL